MCEAKTNASLLLGGEGKKTDVSQNMCRRPCASYSRVGRHRAMHDAECPSIPYAKDKQKKDYTCARKGAQLP